MEKLVYLILSRDKDNFNMLYADQCEKTDDSAFFTKNSQFKCWLEKSGSENLLYLAILPLFDSDASERYRILHKIISRYHPPCSDDASSKSDNK